MKLSSSIPVLALAMAAVISVARAAGGSVSDYQKTQQQLSPTATSTRPAAKPPATASAVQSKQIRIEPRALTATNVRESAAPRPTNTHLRKPSTLAPPVQAPQKRQVGSPRIFSPEGARMTTAPVRRSGLVSRYQTQLSSRNAVYVGRTPSVDRGGTARLNRFLFRRAGKTARVDSPAVVRAGSAAADQP